MKRGMFSVALVLLCSTAFAASDITLSGLKMGKTVFGPDLSLDDLKGKVVLVDFWGTH